MNTQTKLDDSSVETYATDTSIEDARWLLGTVLVLGLMVLGAGVTASLLGG